MEIESFELTGRGKTLYLAIAESTGLTDIDPNEDPVGQLYEGIRQLGKHMLEDPAEDCTACSNDDCPLLGVSTEEEMFKRLLKHFIYYALAFSKASAKFPFLLEAFMATVEDVSGKMGMLSAMLGPGMEVLRKKGNGEDDDFDKDA